jgi:hypothetical protein
MRVLAVFVLVQLVGAQVLSALHHALARHVYCPVHGVFEHVKSHPQAKLVVGSVVRHACPSATSAPADGHEHNACGVLLASEHRSVEPGSAVAVDVSKCAGLAPAPIFERTTAYVTEVLSNAPKRSPPA